MNAASGEVPAESAFLSRPRLGRKWHPLRHKRSQSPSEGISAEQCNHHHKISVGVPRERGSGRRVLPLDLSLAAQLAKPPPSPATDLALLLSGPGRAQTGFSSRRIPTGRRGLEGGNPGRCQDRSTWGPDTAGWHAGRGRSLRSRARGGSLPSSLTCGCGSEAADSVAATQGLGPRGQRAGCPGSLDAAAAVPVVEPQHML